MDTRGPPLVLRIIPYEKVNLFFYLSPFFLFTEVPYREPDIIISCAHTYNLIYHILIIKSIGFSFF